MKFKYQKLPFVGYDPRWPLVARPFLPIYLHHQGLCTRSSYYALLDSGADVVLLPSDLAREVGITDIRSGKHGSAVGIAGQMADVYYHDVEIEVVGELRKLALTVGFSNYIVVPILGRNFFRYYRVVVFSEQKEEVELKP